MIPNTIHCCWLGGGPKTALAEKCRVSWRKFAPGWEIREWTAADLAALDPPPFVDEAMRRGQWAFAADWLRFAALAAEGGVYLDYDVELVRPLAVDGEFVAGQWLPGGKVGMEPAVLALEKGSAVAAAMLEAYRGASFDAVRTVGERLGEALDAKGISVKVLPPEVFCPIDVDGSLRATDATIGVHHYAMAWAGPVRRFARWLSWHGMRRVVDALLRLRNAVAHGALGKALIAVGAALALVSVVQGFRNGLVLVDFHWESAALFLRGENPYRWFFDGRLYDGVVVDATQAPSTIAFILPFGLLPHAFANTLWDVSNLLFTAVFLFFVQRLFFRPAKAPRAFWAFVILFLCGVPWRVGMGCGQHAMFSLAFFAAALWAMERRLHWAVVGALLSAALFKYTVTAPLALVFVIRRQWKAVGFAAAVHLALTTALGCWTHTSPLTLVVESVRVGATLKPIGDADLMGLARWFGVADLWPWAFAGYAVFGAAMLAFAVRRGSRSDGGTALLLFDLAVLALLADVFFYHRCYDFVSLAFSLACCLLAKPSAFTAMCWLVVLNTFFFLRLDFALGLGVYVPVNFALHLAALALAALACCRSHKVPEV